MDFFYKLNLHKKIDYWKFLNTFRKKRLNFPRNFVLNWIMSVTGFLYHQMTENLWESRMSSHVLRSYLVGWGFQHYVRVAMEHAATLTGEVWSAEIKNKYNFEFFNSWTYVKQNLNF